MDQQLFVLLNNLPHNGFFDGLARFLSGIGSFGLIWYIVGILRARKFLPRLLVAGFASWILVEWILKPWIARPRPTPEIDGFSFPSGHATIAFAMAVILAKAQPRLRKWFFALAVAISFSRIYLGVHYPFDVIGGALLGVAIGKASLR